MLLDPSVGGEASAAVDVLTVGTAAYAAGKVAATFFVDRAIQTYGARAIIICSVMGPAIGAGIIAAVAGLAPRFAIPALLAASGGARVFEAQCWPSMTRIVHAWFPGHGSASAWGVLSTSSRVGYVGTDVAYGSLLLTGAVGWGGCYAMTSCVCFAAALLVACALRATPASTAWYDFGGPRAGEGGGDGEGDGVALVATPAAKSARAHRALKGPSAAKREGTSPLLAADHGGGSAMGGAADVAEAGLGGVGGAGGDGAAAAAPLPADATPVLVSATTPRGKRKGARGRRGASPRPERGDVTIVGNGSVAVIADEGSGGVAAAVAARSSDGDAAAPTPQVVVTEDAAATTLPMSPTEPDPTPKAAHEASAAPSLTWSTAMRSFIRMPAFWCACVSVGALTPLGKFKSFLPMFLAVYIGMNPGSAAVAGALYSVGVGLSGFIGGLLWPRLSRWGRMAVLGVLTGGTVACFSTLAAMVAAEQRWQAVVVASGLVVGLCHGFPYYVPANVFATTVGKSFGGSLSSLFDIVGYTGEMLVLSVTSAMLAAAHAPPSEDKDHHAGDGPGAGTADGAAFGAVWSMFATIAAVACVSSVAFVFTLPEDGAEEPAQARVTARGRAAGRRGRRWPRKRSDDGAALAGGVDDDDDGEDDDEGTQLAPGYRSSSSRSRAGRV